MAMTMVMVVPVVMIVVVIMVVVVIMSVLVMIVGMIMPVAVILMAVPMILGVTVIMAMDAPVTIGAAFRVERGFDGRHGGAEPFQHRLDDMVAADAQLLAEKFGWQVAVAEMPGDPHEMGGVAGRDLGQRLRRRLDGDDVAVLEQQPVAMAQRHRVRQVEQEGRAALGRHRDAPAMARIEIEDDGIDGRLGPQAGGIDGDGADHSNDSCWKSAGKPGSRASSTVNGQASGKTRGGSSVSAAAIRLALAYSAARMSAG